MTAQADLRSRWATLPVSLRATEDQMQGQCTPILWMWLFCGLLSPAVVPSSPLQRQTTSLETKTRMIGLIGQLETDPYTKNAKEIRREVLTWLTEAPDVTVQVCPNVLGDIKKLKGDDGATLTVQLALSEAKFILEHPDRASDRHAVNLAGVEGVLRTYQAMKRAKPKLTIDQMDQLVELQSASHLDAFVDAGIAKCN